MQVLSTFTLLNLKTEQLGVFYEHDIVLSVELGCIFKI